MSRNIINRQTTISVGLVLAGITLFTLPGAWVLSDTRWKTNITRDIEDIQTAVSTAARDRWYRTEMQDWRDALVEANPGLVVPKLPRPSNQPID